MSSIPLPALDVKAPQQQDLLQKFGQLQQLQNMRQQSQMQQQEAPYRLQALQGQAQEAQLAVQARQRDAAAQQALNASFAGAMTTGADGKPIFDEAKLAQSLSTGPAAYKTPEVLKGITDFQKGRLDLQTTATDLAGKQADIIGSAASAVKAAGYDPTLAHSLLDTLPQSAQLNQIRAQIDNPEQFHKMIDTAIQNSPKQRQLNVSEATQAETVKRDAATAAQAAATAANTQAYREATLKQGNQRLGIEGARLNFDTKRAGLTPDGTPNPLSRAIATGHIVPDRMGYLLSKNPDLIQGVMAIDPSFDVSKAQSYPTTYKDFTSGKTSVALNAGATALTHLRELSEMNTNESHNPLSREYNAYQNKADTVASELAKFYGDATIPAIAAIKKTLTATLPGHRQAAIETQAKSMGDKLDAFQQTWDNAAPSKAYQAPMPGISKKAMAARAALDPGYKAPSAGGATPQSQGASSGFNWDAHPVVK